MKSKSQMEQKYDNRMTKTDKIALLSRYVLISGLIERDHIAPLSLMLIAPPEHNKTRILKLFSGFPNTLAVDNISSRPLNQMLVRIDHGDVKSINHIIIYDFIRILCQKTAVKEGLLTALLNLTEEGVTKSMFYGQEYDLKKPIQIGMLTGITPDLFRKHFLTWNQDGTLTRWLFCTYHYSPETNNQIKDMILKNLPYKISDDIVGTVKGNGTTRIEISNSHNDRLKEIAKDVENRYKNFNVNKRVGSRLVTIPVNLQGFRMIKMLRVLVQAIAYDRNHDKVTSDDMLDLVDYANLLNLPNTSKEV